MTGEVFSGWRRALDRGRTEETHFSGHRVVLEEFLEKAEEEDVGER